MGIVCGPYSAEEWWMLGNSKKNIAFYSKEDPELFQAALEKNRALRKELLSKTAA